MYWSPPPHLLPLQSHLYQRYVKWSQDFSLVTLPTQYYFHQMFSLTTLRIDDLPDRGNTYNQQFCSFTLKSFLLKKPEMASKVVENAFKIVTPNKSFVIYTRTLKDKLVRGSSLFFLWLVSLAVLMISLKLGVDESTRSHYHSMEREAHGSSSTAETTPSARERCSSYNHFRRLDIFLIVKQLPTYFHSSCLGAWQRGNWLHGLFESLHHHTKKGMPIFVFLLFTSHLTAVSAPLPFLW